MPTNEGRWQSNIVCPFFKSESAGKLRIVCEGCAPHTTITINFYGGEAARTEWLIRYCTSWDYRDCSVAAIAAEKYEERIGKYE